MRLAAVFVPMLILSPLVPAAALDPVLAPAAKTYREQKTKLEDVRVNALIAAQDLYLAELKLADEKAMKDGDTEIVAVVQKEREVMKNGPLAMVAPPELPKKLIPGRKACVKASEKADEDLTKAMQKLNAGYLVALGKVQTGAAGKPELLAQIEDEKKRLLTGLFGPLSNLKTQLPGTRWQSVRDPKDFRSFGTDMVVNNTWKYNIPSETAVEIHWNENSATTLNLSKDGKILLLGGEPDFRLVLEPKKD